MNDSSPRPSINPRTEALVHEGMKKATMPWWKRSSRVPHFTMVDERKNVAARRSLVAKGSMGGHTIAAAFGDHSQLVFSVLPASNRQANEPPVEWDATAEFTNYRGFRKIINGYGSY
jgi:hypothetical protein